MKKTILLGMVLFTLLSGHFTLTAQEHQWKPEKFTAFTDRGLYISGEKIHFVAYDYSKDTLGDISTILYGELVAPDGKQVASGKFRLQNRRAEGCLTIPEHQITGNYYFRVYTKYLRNFGPGSFFYIPVTIVNPFSEKVLEGNNDTTAFDSKNTARQQSADLVQIISNEKFAHPRQQVGITVKTPAQVSQNILGLSVSVVPQYSAANSGHDLANKPGKTEKLTFLPETRGPAISGVVKDSISGKPIANIRVNLSIIGPGRDFMATETNNKGHFNISLPKLKGSRDLFIGTGLTSDSHPEIWIDNDFSTASFKLPNKAFHLTGQQKAVALQMAKNAQISSSFTPDTIPCKIKITKTDTVPFYGKPSYILRLDDYIQLPTLEEYFNELPSLVKVRKKDGKKYFKILGPQPGMDYFKPLVLVDMVAVDNPEQILKAIPSEIDRIEVVNRLYVKGDYSYGGVVNIISRHKDFAGIDLPNSGLFVNYLFRTQTCHCKIQTVKSGMPDTRNTVYWNPNLNLEKGMTQVHFQAPDTPGTYTIIVQGVTKEGKTFLQRAFLTVQ